MLGRAYVFPHKRQRLGLLSDPSSLLSSSSKVAAMMGAVLGEIVVPVVFVIGFVSRICVHDVGLFVVSE